MLTLIGFYMLSAVSLGAALFLVVTRNLLHAVLALGVASLAVAGVLLTLRAEFLALVLVLVYIGAVVVLGVFAVMLTGHFNRPTLPPSNELKITALAVSLALVALLGGVILGQPALAGVKDISLRTLGTLLLTEYVLPFEMVSLVLLAALIGAVVIARGQEDK
jgi:NADH-quinone oxidoreductase subunit J